MAIEYLPGIVVRSLSQSMRVVSGWPIGARNRPITAVWKNSFQRQRKIDMRATCFKWVGGQVEPNRTIPGWNECPFFLDGKIWDFLISPLRPVELRPFRCRTERATNETIGSIHSLVQGGLKTKEETRDLAAHRGSKGQDSLTAGNAIEKGLNSDDASLGMLHSSPTFAWSSMRAKTFMKRCFVDVVRDSLALFSLSYSLRCATPNVPPQLKLQHIH